MADTVHNCQDLTLAALQSLILAETLERGLLYNVTDKTGWLLVANSSSTLVPLRGSLTITNGDTLPTGIEPDVLFVDTGVIDTDITLETGTALDLVIPNNYFPMVLIGRATVNTYPFILVFSGVTDYSDSLNIEFSGYTGVMRFNYNFDADMSANEYKLKSNSAYLKDDTCQAIIEFHRSQFPA